MKILVQVAGCIGTGLFYGLGEILAETGPLGALLVYVHVLTVVYAYVMQHTLVHTSSTDSSLQNYHIRRRNDSIRPHIRFIDTLWYANLAVENRPTNSCGGAQRQGG